MLFRTPHLHSLHLHTLFAYLEYASWERVSKKPVFPSDLSRAPQSARSSRQQPASAELLEQADLVDSVAGPSKGMSPKGREAFPVEGVGEAGHEVTETKSAPLKQRSTQTVRSNHG